MAAKRGSNIVGRYLLEEVKANPYARNRKGFVPYEITAKDEIKFIF